MTLSIDELTQKNQQLTERVRELEQSLEKRNLAEAASVTGQLFEYLFHLSPIPLGVTKFEDGTVFEANEAYFLSMGFTRSEAIGKTTVELNFWVHPEDREQIKNVLLQRGSYQGLEVVYRRRNGEQIAVLQSGELVTINDKKYIISAHLDITRIKDLEMELRLRNQALENSNADLTRAQWDLQRSLEEILRSQEQYRELAASLDVERVRLLVTLRCIGDGVLATDASGRITLVNKAAEQLTGWTPEDAMGHPIDEVMRLVNEHTRLPCESPIARVLRSGVIHHLENNTLLVSKDGVERLISDSGAPIKDKFSRVIGAVVVFRDVTERRRLEQELHKSQRIEAIGILAGGIAHDFNNLLTAIIGNVSLASARAAENKRLTDVLDHAEHAALRAKDLTQQLLTFAKGGQPIKMLTSLEDLVRDSTNFILQGSVVRAEFLIADDLWATEVDPGQISQVIQNLVINARQAMAAGGTLVIRAENYVFADSHPVQGTLGKYVRLSLTDHGPGIPTSQLSRIFDPYFTTKSTGNGLGLAITHSIVQKHDGWIDVASTLGEGVTFSIYLPASDLIPSVPAEPDRVGLTGRGKVLVMDDEELIQATAKALFEELGYDVVLAKDGAEALVQYSRQLELGAPVDLVILDLTIPGGMGGLECIRGLQGLDPNVKAVVSSGYSNDPVMSDFRSHGFAGVIVKPYRLEELQKLLSHLLPQPRDEGAS
ncbi:MAG: PAS domain S-box protein [Myxococcales bacterium]